MTPAPDIQQTLVEVMAEAAWDSMGGHGSWRGLNGSAYLPDDADRTHAITAAEAALTALDAKLREMGLRVVPEVATEEMIFEIAGWIDKEDYSPEEIWNVMLTAFPNPLAPASAGKPND